MAAEVRRFLVVIVLAALLAACAGERPDAAAPTTTAAPTDGDAPATTAAGAPGSGPASTASTLRPRGAGGGAVTATTRPPAGARQPAPAPAGTDRSIAAAAASGVGGFARVLLRPMPATRLVLELQLQANLAPEPAALAHAVDTLASVTAKPVRTTTVSLPGGGRNWTAAQLRELADQAARTPQGDGTAVVRALFVGGRLSENDQAVAAAIRGDLMVVFPDQLEKVTSPFVTRRDAEEAVLVHELGHLMGLVDIALDRNREDPDHPGHSPSQQSVMYWAVESTLLGQVLNGAPPDRFDAADRADLAALRNGA